ncbi:MAG: hydrogen gas-evolving membrane-bound hydrogenase subunit E [Candidatus Omnitrophota bacterium]
MLELQLLLLFMIAGAIIAVEVEDMISSVIAVGAVGLGLCLAFLLLKAPDLAITQLIAEILCLIILIRATLKKDLPLARDGRWFFNTFSTLCFIGIFLAFSYLVLKELPKFGTPIMRISNELLARSLESTGATNFIASVILDFRAYDTLGEATVLFCSVMGVATVMRKIGRKKTKD